MKPTPDTKLSHRARTVVDLSPYNMDEIVHKGGGEILQRLAWEVARSGDRTATRTLTDAVLMSSDHVHAGQSRTRWILQSAFAYADSSKVNVLSDLGKWVNDVEVGLSLSQFVTLDFGLRREGSMTKSFEEAAGRVADMKVLIEEMLNGGWWNNAALIRAVSFGGDLHLCDALSRCLFASGDSGWGTVVYAAQMRNLYQQPSYSYELVQEVLDTSCNPGALAVAAASLGDMALMHPKSDELYKSAAEIALVLIGLEASKYSGNVGRRAFRNMGWTELSGMADHLSKLSQGLIEPPANFDGDSNTYKEMYAAHICVRAGRRDLAELQIRNHWKPEKLFQTYRERADAFEGAPK